MKVCIIGSGNVATVLGRKINAAGHQVIQVFSRNILHAQNLAAELGAAATNDWQGIEGGADIYLLCLSDSAIIEATEKLGHLKGLVLHAAGSLSINILKACSVNCGVLYPLQSLRKEKPHYETIPLLVDGNTSDSLCLVKDFAETISHRVEQAGDSQRLSLHIAAVFVNNFSNHLYSLAAAYCEKEHVSFDLLKPIIEETALRLRDYDPRQFQTGPAVRNDLLTIGKHEQLLAGYPSMLAVYKAITASIQNAAFDGLNK